MKKNCWEFKKCGRHPGSRNTGKKKECVAASMSLYDGVNGGKNGGRACWIIAGTMCGDESQETFAHKLESCSKCDFYLAIKREEGDALSIPLEFVENLMGRMK